MALRRHAEPDIGRYVRPSNIQRIALAEFAGAAGRKTAGDRQLDLLRSTKSEDVFIYCAGNVELLRRPAVSIVGTRNVSPEGYRRASKLARQLSESGIVVMSGLAKGVDAAAHHGAIDSDGATIAVIGTPLDRAYPAENSDLQMQIYRRHLLVSPFSVGEATYKSNFPKRNRVMALLSNATVIVEASDTSGTLHQAAECQRLGRWLFIMRSVIDDPSLTWPAKFIGGPKTVILESTDDIVSRVSGEDNSR